MAVKPRAYYNEFNPYAAQWLRNLIDAGLIAPGDVDERSIEDVTANDLRGYTQWHFFAGIGGWSRALRLAGWPDSERVITASCPCQPFSTAGEGAGFADERHLWPACYWLITQLPAVPVFGEQVASRNANPWCDLVQSDMEAVGYRFGAVPFPAAGVGAAHIRERIYWVAHPSGHGRREAGRGEPEAWGDGAERDGAVGVMARPDGVLGGLGHADHAGLEGHSSGHQAQGGRVGTLRPVAEAGEPSGVADAEQLGDRGQEPPPGDRQPQADRPADQHSGRGCASGVLERHRWTGPLHGFWRDADWLFCRDGKWRPVEPGSRPLVDGLPKWVGRSGPDWRTPSSAPTAEGKTWPSHRVERLKGYGNAIVPPQAALFIEQCIGTLDLIMTTNIHLTLVRDIVHRAIRDELIGWEAGFDLQRAIEKHVGREKLDALKTLRFHHIDEFSACIKALIADKPIDVVAAKPQTQGAPVDPRAPTAAFGADPFGMATFGSTSAPAGDVPFVL